METRAESVETVIAELRTFLNDGFTTHALLQLGLRQAPTVFDAHPPPVENPDPMFYVGTGDPNVELASYAELRLSEVRERFAVGGRLDYAIGHQWVVYTFTGWEHEYRPRLARAIDIQGDAIQLPLLGDLRLLRNDVVHHHGVATVDNSARCAVIRHWVQVGQPLWIGGEQIAEFARLFPWGELKGPALTGEA